MCRAKAALPERCARTSSFAASFNVRKVMRLFYVDFSVPQLNITSDVTVYNASFDSNLEHGDVQRQNIVGINGPWFEANGCFTGSAISPHAKELY